MDLFDEYIVFGYVRQECNGDILSNTSFKIITNTCLSYYYLKEKLIHNTDNDTTSGLWTFGSTPIVLTDLHKYQQIIKIENLDENINECSIGIVSDTNIKYDPFNKMINHIKFLYGLSMGKADYVSIDINLKSKQLGFSVNGKDKSIPFTNMYKNNETKYFLSIYLSSKYDKVCIINKGIEEIKNCCNNYIEYKLKHKYGHLYIMIALNRMQTIYKINDIPSDIKEIIYQYVHIGSVGETIDISVKRGEWYKAQILKHKLPSTNHNKLQYLEGFYVHDMNEHKLIRKRSDQWIYIRKNSLCECNKLCYIHCITTANNHKQSEMYWTKLKEKVEILKRSIGPRIGRPITYNRERRRRAANIESNNIRTDK